jgi:hypothetical protein
MKTKDMIKKMLEEIMKASETKMWVEEEELKDVLFSNEKTMLTLYESSYSWIRFCFDKEENLIDTWWQ